MEMHVEFKKADTDEAFEDGTATTNHCFEKDTQLGREERGQITAYALAQLSHQFRCFAFSLFITGKFVRFIRWDRAGAVVSSRFDYTEHPLLLAKFFWNYSHSSPQKRGIDTTVTLACFDGHSEDEIRIRRILGLKKSVPLYRYEVPEDDQERARDGSQGHPLTPHYYYGPMPPCLTMSLIGRSTRSLPVVDLNKQDDDEAHVYLKDAWRIDAPPIEKEGDIYRLLHAAKVPHIMPFERGNDVITHGYRTQTQLVALRIWGRSRRALTGHIHYRMVLGVVGRALTSFSSSKVFVSAIHDALIGELMCCACRSDLIPGCTSQPIHGHLRMRISCIATSAQGILSMGLRVAISSIGIYARD